MSQVHREAWISRDCQMAMAGGVINKSQVGCWWGDNQKKNRIFGSFFM